MWMRYDQFTKALFDKTLGLAGVVATQLEIAGEVQAADLWFRPAPGREGVRDRLGVLGRMAGAPCLIEAFHGTPSIDAVRACINKQLTLYRNLCRDAARPSNAGQGPPPMPRLWILSTGRPHQVMDALALQPMGGWPAGCWEAAPGLHVHLVVLRDLPAGRDTLLLRLLGAGKTYARAVHELDALPRDAWETELAIPLLLAFRVEFPQTTREDAMNQANELQAIYDAWEKRVVHTAWQGGEEAARKAERRQSLRMVYQARFGELPPAVQAAIESTENIDTLQQWVAPFATATPAQIAALVRER